MPLPPVIARRQAAFLRSHVILDLAVINSGGGDPSKANGLAQHRTWLLHGAKDKIVGVNNSETMFEALLKVRGADRRVLTEDDWVKASDTGDTIRFWNLTQSGHVPHFDYGTALDWVLRLK